MSRGSWDAVVVGGGFAGLGAATALAQLGLRVAVAEALAGPIEALRGELIHPPGVRALAQLGLEPLLREQGAVEVGGFAVFAGPEAGPVKLEYPRGVGLGLEHRVLVGALRQGVEAQRRVTLFGGARVDDVLCEAGRVAGVRCADGRELRAKLVVACDGRHSRLRTLLGIPAEVALRSLTIGVAVEREVLPEGPYGHLMLGGPGPVLAYPFGRRRVRLNLDVPLSAPRGREALTRYLVAHHAPVLPAPLRVALEEAASSAPFMACANHEITTDVCAVPGAALVGDAGGCSHPLSATGMTSALHDVLTLAACVADHGLDDAALLAYQQRRYRYVRAREAFAHALYEVFLGERPGARALAEGVLRYWSEPRARQVSMAILSGDESGVGAFLAEYLRVVGNSGRSALGSAVRGGDVLGAGRSVGQVLGLARDCVGVALDKVLATLASEHARHLAALSELRPAPRPARALRSAPLQTAPARAVNPR